MSEFPSAVKNFLILNDGVDKVIAAHPNDRGGEITAIETFVGALGAGNTQSHSASILDMLQGLRVGTDLSFVGVEDLSVDAGSIAFEASGKHRLRENPTATNVDWSNLDTGVEANDTYYVYAVADTTATTFTILISLSDSAPLGATYYKRIGSFINETDIDEVSVVDDLYGGAFGAWTSATIGSNTQATSDGWLKIVAVGGSGDKGHMVVKTDASATPSVIRGGCTCADETTGNTNFINGDCIPIKKDDYYNITTTVLLGSPTFTAFFTPR